MKGEANILMALVGLGAVLGMGTIFFPTDTLINGTLNVSENVTAKYFFGDGSYLTGISSGSGGNPFANITTPMFYSNPRDAGWKFNNSEGTIIYTMDDDGNIQLASGSSFVADSIAASSLSITEFYTNKIRGEYITGSFRNLTLDRYTSYIFLNGTINATEGIIAKNMTSNGNITMKATATTSNDTSFFIYDSSGICKVRQFWNGTHFRITSC